MNPRKDLPLAAELPSPPPGGASESAPPPSPPASPVPPAPDEPRSRRLVRHLPRAGLILFLLAILIVFHSVLLPFVLAVFVAYLIYPVVRRLEQIPIGRRRPPRWLAVISVYTLLFVVGWWTIPPLVANFAEQFRKLLHDIPTVFEKVGAQRKKLDAWVASMLEVQSLSESSRVALFADVEALAEGRLERFEPPEGIEVPPPPREGATAVAAAERPEPVPAPTVIQLIGIHLQFGAPPEVRLEPAPEDAGTPPGEDAEASPPAEGDGSAAVPAEDEELPPEPTAELTAPKPRRFDEAKGNELKHALRDAINAELEKPGAARGVPAKVEREIVPELVLTKVGLPPEDPDVQLFARNTGARVAAVVQREDYGKVVNAYVGSALEASKNWVQGELGSVPGIATGIGYGLVRGIFDFFMVLMLTAFFLVFFPRIRDYVRDLVAPQYREHYAQVLKRIDTRLSGAIRGQVIICIVNAVLTFPGLWFIGAHTDATNLAAYAVLLSVIAGILSMIPIFGVILSTVPMVVLALAQGSVWGAVLVIGWICVIHAVEAYLLNPNILGHSASMNPIIVVFALLAGKQIYGLVGALLAVPVASVLVSLFGYYRRLVVESATPEGTAAQADPWGD